MQAPELDPLRGTAAGPDAGPGVRRRAGVADQPLPGPQGPREALRGRCQGPGRGRGGFPRRSGRLPGKGLYARLSRHRGHRRHRGTQAARHAAERRCHLRVSRSRITSSRSAWSTGASSTACPNETVDRLRRLREGGRRLSAVCRRTRGRRARATTRRCSTTRREANVADRRRRVQLSGAAGLRRRRPRPSNALKGEQ